MDTTTADQSNAITLGEFMAYVGMGEQKKGGKKQVAKGTSTKGACDGLRWVFTNLIAQLEDVICLLAVLEARSAPGERVDLGKYITQREGGGAMAAAKKVSKAAPKKSAAKAKGKIGKGVKKK